MAGRKQFDERNAVKEATDLFWERGYEAASLTDLEAATGLNKSSLYNAYGSKEGLYLKCLEYYFECYGGALLVELESGDFKTSITGFFDTLIARLEDKSLPRGCLMTRTAMEMGGKPGRLASDTLDKLRRAFQRRCEEAVESGELEAGTDCEAKAAGLLATSLGLTVMNQGFGDTNMLREAVRGMVV